MIDINRSRKSNGLGRHDQIVHFTNKEKRYIQGILFIWENEWTHIVDYLGVEFIINKDNVNFIERFSRGGEGYGGRQKGQRRDARGVAKVGQRKTEKGRTIYRRAMEQKTSR